MTTRSSFRSAVAAAAIAAMLSGCVSAGSKVSSSGFGGEASGEVGMATRALSALAAGNSTDAIGYAERAVEQNPDDAGFRSLLGNAYFAAGRFHSAEAAYKDALSIYGNQPRTILKLALAEIALGKSDEAVRFLEAGKSVLDASNYGLALALAGQPDQAVSLLETAARAQGADAQIRQNLALAYALSGNWTQARVIASQDVPATQLDSRLQQWAQLAHPAKAGDQVAALTGVKPAVSDQGQPVRLALHRDTTQQMAAAAPLPQPVVEAPVAPPPAPLAFVAAAPAPAPEPKFAEPVAPPPPPPAPVVEQTEAVAPAPPPVDPARVAAMAPEAPAAFVAAMFAAPVHKAAAKPKLKPVAAAAPKRAAPVRHAALPKPGKVNAVVQLGAFSSADRVQVAWDKAARRYAVLRAYAPMSARYASPKGIFYRLSVKGFANKAEAANLCASLKRSGRACFVRTFAGDAPMEIASR
jgi:Flp pilus assembly protein TadD